MAYVLPTPASEDSDEPLPPPRSPSRLDFCTEEFEHSGVSNEPDEDLVARLEEAAHKMDWAGADSPDHRGYSPMYVEEDADELNLAPLNPSRLPIVESDDDSPPTTGSCPNGDPNTPHISPGPLGISPHYPVIEPHAPVPVRPSSMQPHLDVQEPTQPSRLAAQRLNYPHHGFSRSALLHQKSFWNSRQEEWVEWQTRVVQEEAPNPAYTGIAAAELRTVTSPPPYMRTPPSGLERDLREHPPGRYDQDVHAPIYPRVGDISALRDPYSVEIDRCFCKFPLWTLHKTLYVSEMYQRSALFPSSPSGTTSAKVPKSNSSSTLSSYTSGSSEDDEDSDDTLVAEDQPAPKYDDTPPESSSRTSSSLSLPKSHPWDRCCEWQMSWYSRWELLVGLVQRDESQRQALSCSTRLASPVEEPVVPPAPPKPMFHLADEGEEDSDEEDYGTLVSDPIFGADFEDGYQRAIAFFSRESRRSEETL